MQDSSPGPSLGCGAHKHPGGRAVPRMQGKGQGRLVHMLPSLWLGVYVSERPDLLQKAKRSQGTDSPLPVPRVGGVSLWLVAAQLDAEGGYTTTLRLCDTSVSGRPAGRRALMGWEGGDTKALSLQARGDSRESEKLARPPAEARRATSMSLRAGRAPQAPQAPCADKLPTWEQLRTGLELPRFPGHDLWHVFPLRFKFSPLSLTGRRIFSIFWEVWEVWTGCAQRLHATEKKNNVACHRQSVSPQQLLAAWVLNSNVSLRSIYLCVEPDVCGETHLRRRLEFGFRGKRSWNYLNSNVGSLQRNRKENSVHSTFQEREERKKEQNLS